MENGNKKSLPFVFILITMICSLLILGWAFVGYVSGYNLITVWENVWFVLIALLQIFSFMAIILILVCSIWGWIFAAGKAKELKVGEWGLKTIVEFLFTVYICLVSLVFIFGIVAGSVNYNGFGNIGVSFGLVLYFIVMIAAYITYHIMRKKQMFEDDGLFAAMDKKSKKSKKVSVQEEEGYIKPAFQPQQPHSAPKQEQPKQLESAKPAVEAKAQPVKQEQQTSIKAEAKQDTKSE